MAHNVDYKEIGRRIESRRKSLDLTLTELASQVDLAASTIQRYEKGSFDRIKLPVIEAIAAALHVNPEWLIGDTDDPTDYEDGDLLAQIPLSYVEACNGDMKKAYAMLCAADQDALHEREVLAPALDDLKGYSKEIISMLKTIADSLEQLNSEGQEKLLDYAADLVASGRYIKSYQSEMDKKQA